MSLYELYLIYVRERRGVSVALFVLSLLGAVALVAVFAFWQLGTLVASDLEKQLGAGTVVVLGSSFTDRDLAAALSLGCFSGGYGVSTIAGALRYPNGTSREIAVVAVPAGVYGVVGAAAVANAYYAKSGEVYRLVVLGKETVIYVKDVKRQIAFLLGLSGDVYVDRALLGNPPYNALLLQKVDDSCVRELRGLFPGAAVIDSDELISALWGQLLVYLSGAALVALSTTAAVGALIYTYATTMYYTHFKEFAILRTLGLKRRGLAALALMLFSLPAVAGAVAATIAMLLIEIDGVSASQAASISAAIIITTSLLAPLPALRRLYKITPAEALRTE